MDAGAGLIAKRRHVLSKVFRPQPSEPTDSDALDLAARDEFKHQTPADAEHGSRFLDGQQHSFDGWFWRPSSRWDGGGASRHVVLLDLGTFEDCHWRLP